MSNVNPPTNPPLDAQSANSFASIGVIGGGAWGTALAQLCAVNGAEVTLWAREEEVVNGVNAQNENPVYLKGEPLHPSIRATNKMGDLTGREAFVFTTPAQFARRVLPELRAVAKENAPVALCSKGIEQETGLMQSEVLADLWPSARPAALSGPSFARDVVKGLPTAVTLACKDSALGARWMATIGTARFRPYLSDDILGAELGGAVKNVLAIAAGAVVGMGFGDSARAALIARGFVEFTRLGRALGAKPETMGGLSGLGDLILTTGSLQSRNMSLGVELGKGRALQDILDERNTVSEGVATAPAIKQLAKNAGIDMPICEGVAALVSGQVDLNSLVNDLLSRPFRAEIDAS